VGLNRNGLPMGMQIIGKRKSDLDLIAFAKNMKPYSLAQK
jgi:Asp-tRNA(Asn)/Glu-tRNA(Gln) amidotransferase A subunit family amidase